MPFLKFSVFKQIDNLIFSTKKISNEKVPFNNNANFLQKTTGGVLLVKFRNIEPLVYVVDIFYLNTFKIHVKFNFEASA
jgi:hypothetical protein